MQFLLVLALTLAQGEPIQTKDPPPPNVTGWTVVAKKQLDVRVDDYQTAFVGLVTAYQNPSDPSEFVRVYSRQITLVSQRPQEKSRNDSQGRSGLTLNAAGNFHHNQEREALERVQKETDPFAYVRWRAQTDSRLSQQVLIEKVESWLFNQWGVWTYRHGEQIQESPLTLPVHDSKLTPMVGLRYTLGEAVHVVQVDINAVVPKKKDKKDGVSGNAK